MDFLGKNTRVGCHILLQGIFPTQESNPYLLHWRADSLPPNHPGSQHNDGEQFSCANWPLGYLLLWCACSSILSSFFRLCFLLSVCGSSLSILIANPLLGVYIDFLLVCDLSFSLFNDFHLLAAFNFTAIVYHFLSVRVGASVSCLKKNVCLPQGHRNIVYSLLKIYRFKFLI